MIQPSRSAWETLGVTLQSSNLSLETHAKYLPLAALAATTARCICFLNEINVTALELNLINFDGKDATFNLTSIIPPLTSTTLTNSPHGWMSLG
jgi:hypothetical protein